MDASFLTSYPDFLQYYIENLVSITQIYVNIDGKKHLEGNNDIGKRKIMIVTIGR